MDIMIFSVCVCGCVSSSRNVLLRADNKVETVAVDEGAEEPVRHDS